MQHKLNAAPAVEFSKREDAFDLASLLYPAQAFEHPRNVVNDPDLTLNEKRAILAAWASDACAVEAAPELRQAPGSRQPVRFDEIMEALRELDKQAEEENAEPARYRRFVRKQRLSFRTKFTDRGAGQPLN